MRPITIVIPGDYWDTFLYRDYLYLWGMDNSVHVVDWNRLAEHLAESVGSGLLHVAIAEGERLYGPTGLAFLEDKDISKQVFKTLSSFSEKVFEIQPALLNKFSVGHQESPFPLLSDDLDFYYNHVYVATEDGIFCANADKSAKRKNPISANLTRVSERRAYTLRVQSGRVAIGCGDEGLFETYVGSSDSLHSNEPKRVSKNPAKCVSWQFASVFAASDDSAFLAGYSWDYDENRRPHRRFERFATETEIFGAKEAGVDSLSFGAQDKLYRVIGSQLQIRKFRQSLLRPDEDKPAFLSIGEHSVGDYTHGAVPVQAGVGAFGIVLQYVDRLVVAQSDGKLSIFKGAVSKTRVFPKSIHYEGHLHAILEDRVVMQIFATDFMQKQSEKLFGIAVTPRRADITL